MDHHHNNTTRTKPNTNGTHHHHNHHQSSSSSASFKGCCCCLFLLFSFLLLLALAVALVVILAVKPKKPQFTLQQVNIQYVGVTPVPDPTSPTSTSASVSLSILMVFTAVNDNKVGIKYCDTKFNIMYRGVPLGRGTAGGFYQPAHSVREVETVVRVDRVNLMEADAESLIRDVEVTDRVELRVLGDVGARIRIFGLTSPGVLVSIDCLIVISPKKQSLTDKQCGFDGVSV